MIRAMFELNEDTHSIGMRLKGHAGMSTIGNDVICASASILAYTIGQIVKTSSEMGKTEGEPMIKLEKGNATISCVCKPEYYAEMVHAFVVIETGLHLLANQYPNFVNLKMFGQP